MSEIKNSNPQEAVKQLQTYKTDKLAELLAVVSREKARAAVLRTSIKATADKLAEQAEIEAERAKAEVQAQVEAPATPEPTPVPVAVEEPIAEEPAVESVQPEEIPAVDDAPANTAAEETATVETTDTAEVAVEEVAPVVEEKAKKVEKPDKAEKAIKAEKPEKTDKPVVAEKPEKTDKPAKAEKSDNAEKAKPVEEKPKKAESVLEPTSNPCIFIKHNPDGTTQKVYIAAPAVHTEKAKTARPERDGREKNKANDNWVITNGNTGSGAPRGPRPPRPATGGAPSLSGVGAPPPAFPPKGGKVASKGGPKSTDNAKRFDDKSSNKRSLMKKGYIVDETKMLMDDEDPRWRSSGAFKKQRGQSSQNAIVIEHAIITTNPVPIKVLSEKIGKSAAEIVRTLFILGIHKTINENIDFETAELVTESLSEGNPITLEFKPESTFEEELMAKRVVNDEKDGDKLVQRPPVVTIMGHVDHGKTSLLDKIRKTNVTGGEAGGITQHIGAYTITLKGEPITFLDTPGHEAFTAMRARGAQGADIAVLVVAADDGIMPQTLESISHAKLAKVPIIVACNKIDKVGANPDKVLQQLADNGLLPEAWGGDVPVVKVSAKTGEGIEELLENILTLAEMRELRANPNRPARGTIIEAKLDKSMGKTATILVHTGTLKCGDYVIAGCCTGKIRIMKDDKGRLVKKAGPSVPVSVTGWDEIPEAGDVLDVVEDEKFAKQLAEERQLIASAKLASKSGGAKDINDLFSGNDGQKCIALVIKADVQGSLEALKQSLGALGNEEVEIKIVHGGVGAINESDVSIADSSHAIIIGFNVRPDTMAKASSAQKGVDIRFYDIIYTAIEDIQNAVHGMLAPVFKEVVLGSAEIRDVFKISGVGNIAGCHVIDGKIVRGAKARLIRNGKVVANSEISSLRHEKDDVKEIAKNFDCGIMLLNYADVKVEDVIEAYQMEQI